MATSRLQKLRAEALCLLLLLTPMLHAAGTALPPGNWKNLLHLGSSASDRITGYPTSGQSIVWDNMRFAGIGPERIQQPHQGQFVDPRLSSTQNPMVWTALTDADGVWGGMSDSSVSYYAIYIWAPSDRSAKLAYDQNYGLRVSMDGIEPPLVNLTAPATGSTSAFTLTSGWHSFIIKTHANGSGDHFALRLTDSGGADLTDLEYQLSDPIAPTVTSNTPAEGAANVPLWSEIQFIFSEPMDTSVNPNTVASIVGGSVAGTWSWMDTYILTFTPASVWQQSAAYSVTLNGSAKDISGNSIVPVTYHFSVASTVSTPLANALNQPITTRAIQNLTLSGSGFTQGGVIHPAGAMPFAGHYYQYYNQMTSWQNAKALGAAQSGHLVTPTSISEDDFVWRFGGFTNNWIGLTDETVEGTFVWITGETDSYRHFAPGEPSDWGDEDYGIYWWGFQWNDVPSDASAQRPYVIEFEQLAAPTLVFKKSGQPDIAATNVHYITSGSLSFDVDTSTAALGAWDLVVTNPDGGTATLQNALTIDIVGARVTSIYPANGSLLTTPPTNIVANFDRNLNAATVHAGNFKLVGSGPDQIFGTPDDVVIMPAAVSVNANVATLDLTGVTLPGDNYTVVLTGTSGSGKVLRFNGTSSFVNAPKWLSGTGSAATFECWVWPNTPQRRKGMMFMHRAYFNDSTLEWDFINRGYFEWNVRGGSPFDHYLDTQSVLNEDKWYHVAATWDGTLQRIYVNGQFEGSLARAGSMNWDQNYFGSFLGGDGYDGWGGFLEGDMQEVRIWNVARSQAQIQAGMWGLATPQPGLRAYYKMHEGSGQIVTDSSGNGLHATLGANLAAASDDPAWASSFSPIGICIRDVYGNAIDGEFSGTFPSGDGTAGGNFTSTFKINKAPVAYDLNTTVVPPNNVPITLTASDTDNDPLVWTILTQPQHGSLSGTAPSLTYTPDLSFTTADSFTFKVNDGYHDSNIATVTISTPTVVTAISPAPGAVLTSPSTSIAVTFSRDIDQASVNANTVRLVWRGSDGLFDTADDVVVTPSTAIVNGNVLTLGMSAPMLNDTYRITIGSNSPAPANVSGRWKFDEVGTSAADSSGNNNTGTYLSGASQTAGKSGSGALLDGVDDYISIPNSSSVNPTSAWTLAAWIKLNSIGTQQAIMEKYDPVLGTGSFAMRVLSDGHLAGLLLNNPNRDTVTSSQILNAGVWYHVAVTYDSSQSTLKAYVNGQPDGSISTTLTQPPSSYSLKIGARGDDSGTPFGGVIDDACIYGRALTLSEIGVLMQSVAPAGVKDVYGQFIDGEPSANFPSGNGVPDGDFTATFTVNVPPATVTALSPAPDAVLSAPPASIAVTFSANIDPASVTAGNVALIGRGPDGVFDTADDSVITPAGISVAGNVVTLGLTGVSLPNDTYQVKLLGRVGAGKALSFNTNMMVKIPGFGLVVPPNEITVEFWQRETATSQSVTFGMNPDDQNNRFNGHFPWMNNQIYWDYGNYVSGPGRLEYSSPNIQDTWHHFALVASASGNFMKIYRNGVLEASKTGVAGFSPVLSDLWIGRDGSLYSFAGQIDEFRIWNKARSAAEISATWNRTLSGNESGLVAYWNFDEGSGQLVHDRTTGAHDGTLGADANAGADDPVWVGSGAPIIAGITDMNGNAIDGEPNAGLPSGNGVAGGDFTATFTVNAPLTTVTAASPAPGSTLSTPPSSVTVTLSAPPNSATLAGNVTLVGAGPDGQFDTADDRLISPSSVSTSGSAITLDLSGINMINDTYRVKLYSSKGAGTALSFSAGTMVRIPNYGMVIPSSEVTIEFWQRATSASNSVTFGMNPDDYYNRFNGHFSFNGTIIWDYGDYVTGPARLQYPAPNILNQWHHFALVASTSGNYMRIYRNGVLESEKSGVDGFDQVVSDLWIGRDGTQYSFLGQIDEFRVWNRARSAVEIASSWNRTLSGSEPGLISYWNFDEASGQIVQDRTAGAHNGTLGADANPGADDPVWVGSGAPIIAGITDMNGNAIDGEPNASLPSGNGTAGGDFTATFTVNAPLLQVAAMTPAPNTALAPIDTLTVTMTQPPNPATVSAATVQLTAAGPDNTFDTADDVQVSPASVSLNGNQIALGLSGPLAIGNYRLRLSAGDLDKGLSFDGNDWVSLPDNIVHGSTAITVECWFKTSSPGGIFGYSTNSYPNGPGSWVPALYLGASDGKLRGQIGNMTANPITTPGSMTDGKWHHAALSSQANGNQAFYVDGQLIGTTSGALNHLNMVKNYIGIAATGNWPGNTNGDPGWVFFNGQLDEFRIWNVARTQSEIQSTMRSVLSGNQSGLLACWHFDETSGQVVSDATANHLNGTLGASSSVGADDPAHGAPAAPLSGVSDLYGNTMDGEYVNSFPSGNGTPGGDFVATFTIANGPYASSQSLMVRGGVPKPVTLSATNPNNATLVWKIVTPPEHGALSGAAPNLTYTPDGTYTTGDSFTFKVNDGFFDSNTGTVTITAPTTVTALSVAPGGTLAAPPTSITVTFSQNIDPASVTTQTFQLVGSGPDGVFDTADDVSIIPTGLDVNENTATLDFTGVKIKSDTYHIVLRTNSGELPSSGLICKWNFSEGTGTIAHDQSGNGTDGTLLNGTSWGSSSVGATANFDGIDDGIRINRSASTEPLQGITVCMWALITDTGPEFGDLVRKAATYQDGILLRWYHTSPTLSWHVDRSAGNVHVLDSQPNSAYINRWHHFAGTYDSATGQAVLYVDGVMHNSVNGGSGDLAYSDDLYLMYNAPDHKALPGQVSDFRLYNRALSAAEIHTVVAGITDINGNAIDGEPNAQFPSGNGTLGGDFIATFTVNTPPLQVTALSITPGSVLTAPPTSITATFSANVDPASVTAGNFILTGRGPDGQFDTDDDVLVTPAGVSVNGNTVALDLTGVKVPNDQYRITLYSGMTAPVAGLKAYWNFDEGTGITAADSSGNNVNGTVNNATWGPGVKGGALNFNGNNSNVNLGAASIPPPWSASLWVKRQDSTNVSADLMVSGSYYLKLEQNANTEKVGFTTLTVADYAFNYIAPIGTWVHLTYVGTTTGTSLYVNGAFIGTDPHSINMPMGTIGSTINSINGTLDEFRVYNRALTPSEIRNLAMTGIADPYGNLLDGEPHATFPSGNGTPGGDFTATFRVDAPPTAFNQAFSIHAGTSWPVVLNGTDADNDPLTFTVLTQPAHGTLSGTPPFVTYTPFPTYVGDDSFTYKANDGYRDSSSATVSFTMTNAVPVVSDLSLVSHGGLPKLVPLGATDADGDTLTLSVASLPEHGTLSGSPPNLIYTAELGYVGNDQFTYRASDGIDSATASVLISVTNAGPSVVIAASPTSVVPNAPVTFNSTGSDPDGDSLAYSWDFGDGGSSNAQNPAHAYSQVGTYLATVTVTDPSGASASATIIIQVSKAPIVRVTTDEVVGFGGIPLLFDASYSTDPENQIASYDWDFGDGTPHGSGQIISKIYDQPGTYTVTLTITDAAGVSSSLTRVIEVLSGDEVGLFNGYMKYKVAWNRRSENKDSLNFEAGVNVGDDLIRKGTTLALEIVGQRFTGTLDTKLRDFRNKDAKWQVKAQIRHQPFGTVVIKATIKHASLGLSFNQAGAVAGGDPHDIVSKDIPVHLEIGGHSYEMFVPTDFKFSGDRSRAKGDGASE